MLIFNSIWNPSSKIILWLFGNDHINYARWLSIQLHNLIDLPILCPTPHIQFCEGTFVTVKTTHKFSAIALDQCHEQQNAIVKGFGGVIGITENKEAL